MTATTLSRADRMNVSLFTGGFQSLAQRISKKSYRDYKKADGKTGRALVLEQVPVFRSGTFRDSMGFQHTWEPMQIDQMVAHYDLLRNREIFADVPVRDGHPGFLTSGQEGNGKVIGYHTGIASGEYEVATGKYTFLLANFEILDPEYQAKYEAGLLRNRSSEVGEYTTNDEATFWPVYMGFAFVDIPAVEGLNGFAHVKENDRQFTVMIDKENPVSGETQNGGGQPAAQGAPAQATATVTVPAAAPAAAAPAAAATEVAPAQAVTGGGQPVAATVPADQGNQGQSDHSRSSAPHAFSINGQQTTDFAAVQSHISRLEQFQSDTIAQSRRDFVTGLAKANKILAPQVGDDKEGLTAFALSLSPEQFESWKASWDAAPASTVLSQHGNGTTNSSGQPGGDAQSQEMADLEEVIASFRRSNMSQDKIEKTGAWAKLQALKATKN